MLIPKELIEAIQDDNLVLWVGSGYSTNLDFPKWDGLVEHFARIYFEDSPEELAAFLELLYPQNKEERQPLSELLKQLADLKKRERLLDTLPELLKLRITNPDDPIYNKFRLLWDLSDKIVTTNYDRALDITIKNTETQPILWHNHLNFRAFTENSPHYLFKVHGTVGQIGDNHQRNCVVFEDQYKTVYIPKEPEEGKINTEKETAHFLKYILTRNKVLFIGYGGFDSDINVDNTFKYINSLIGDFSKNRYFYFSVAGKKIARDFLTPIPLDDYDQLEPYLKKLVSYKPDSLRQDDMIDDYPSEYVGRKKEVEALNNFFGAEDSHFLFIWGRGGMGKTHLLKTVLNTNGITYHYYKLGVTTTLQHLANQLKLGIEIREEGGEYSQKFINAIERLNTVIIFDDFYEIDTSENQDSKLKNTLLRLSDIRSNKIIIISRAMESKFEKIDGDIHVDFLKEKEHKLFAQNFVSSNNDYEFEDFDTTVSKIWEISQGYPLVTELLLYILGQPYLYGDFNLDEYESFDFRQFDDDDKYNVGRLVKAVLKGKEKDKEVLNLLYDISISRKEVPTELLKEFFESPRVFKLAHKRKGFIRVNKKEDNTYTFSLHPLIWELVRQEAGKREETHLKYAEYYFSKLMENNHDLEAYRSADYHYGKSPTVYYEEYMNRIRKLKRRVRDIDIDIKTRIALYEIIIHQGEHHPVNYTILARELLKMGRIKRAAKVLIEGKGKNKKNIVILNMLGRIYRYQGRRIPAIQTLEEALKIEMIPQTANELGIAYRENRNLVRSIEILRDALTKFPRNMHISTELGRSLMEKGEYEAAKDVLEKAHKLDRFNKFVSCELGKAYRELGSYNDSINILNLGLDQGPRYSDRNKRFFVELALTFKANNKLQKAIEILEESVENIKHPENNLTAFNQLGKTYSQTGDYSNAIKILIDSIKYNPGEENIHSYTELGIAYQKNKDFEKSIDILEKGLEKLPENPNSANCLARTLRQANEHEKALQVLKKSLSFKKNKNNRHLNRLLFQILLEQKDKNEWLTRVIDEDNFKHLDNVDLNNGINFFLFVQPNKEKAMRFYDQLAKRPNAKQKQLNQQIKYISTLNDIINLRFNTPEDYKKYISEGIRLGFKTETITLLYRLVTVFPDFSFFHSKLGRTLKDISDYENSKEHLKKAIELYKNEKKKEELNKHVFYYLYALLENEDLDKIDEMTQEFSEETQRQPHSFQMFKTKVMEKKGEAFDVICQSYLKSINLAPNDKLKIGYIDKALEYLNANEIDLTENDFALSVLKLKKDLEGNMA